MTWNDASKVLPANTDDVVYVRAGDIYPAVGWFDGDDWFRWDEPHASIKETEKVSCWLPLPEELPDGRLI